MKYRFSGSVALVALAVAGPAVAADMPAKAPVYKATPTVGMAAYNWTGFYVGGHAGWGWSDEDWFIPLTPINIAAGCPGCPVSAGSQTANDWLAGGQVGINYQVGSWVWGVEAQASWTRLEGSHGVPPFPVFTDHSKTDFLGTVAARFGAAWDRTLLYVKGGGAWAHDRFWQSTATIPIVNSVTDTRWGWMAGVGVEFAFLDNWSVKVEYDYLDFGTRRETLAATCTGCSFEYDITQTIQLVKVGINYRFGDFGKGPVVGRY